MADKQFTIKVNAKVDDDSIKELQERLDSLESKVEEVSSAFEGMDSSPIEETASATDDAKSSMDDLESSTESTSDALEGIPSDSVKQVGDSATESASEMDTLLAVASTVGSVMTLDALVNSAGSVSDSMSRVGLTFGSASDEIIAKASEVASSTGRSAGTAREYMIQMGIAGVDNAELLGASFESMSGFAYQSGQSIEQLQSKIYNMVLSGNAGSRQLKALGLSAEDLASAMGVTADEVSEAFKNLSEEERLEVITKAMGDGKQANEEYKQSWQGLQEQLGVAGQQLLASIGTPILSVVVPAMQGLVEVIRTVTTVFKGLPSPIQAVVGGVVGVALGFVALVPMIATAIKSVKAFKSAFDLVKTTMKLDSVVSGISSSLNTLKARLSVVASEVSKLATRIKTTLVSAFNKLKSTIVGVIPKLKALGTALLDAGKKALTAGLNALKSVAMWVAQKVSAVASTMANIALAVSEWLVASPILIIVALVLILVGVLLYLYFTNEDVRNTINWLGQTIMQVATIIGGAIIGALQFLWNCLQTLYTILAQVVGYIVGAVIGAWNSFKSAISTLASILNGIFKSALNTVKSIISTLIGVVQSINNAWNNFKTAVNSAVQPLKDVYNWMMKILNSADPLKALLEAIGGGASGGASGGGDSIGYDLPTGSNNQLIETTTNGGDNILNFYIDNVDSEDRVQQIVDAVTKALTWNNTLAGRTI